MLQVGLPVLLLSSILGAVLRACPQGELEQEVTRSAARKVPSKLTFNADVAKIIFNNCTSCHRPGEIAPFSLLNYKDVKKRARTIQRAIEKRFMPPWHPEPGHGEFRDSRRISDEEIQIIVKWVDDGKLEGQEHKLPRMPEFLDGWQLGKPDMIVSMERAYSVPAGGNDIYRNFVIPLDIKKDKWVSAVEIRPSARTVLHHSLFYLDNSGTARKLDGGSGQPGWRGMGFRRSGSLGGWAVGGTARHLPMNLARRLEKGSDLVLSSHFHPSGKKESEKTTIGLYFTAKPKRRFTVFQIPPRYGRLSNINIPAGEADWRLQDSWKLPVDIDLVTIGGHAHYICKSMRAVATLPDGKKRKLFYIKQWDFNWQGRYTYNDAVRLPKDTIIDVEIVYDNSEGNPFNPNSPPKRIKWGLQSSDEMGSVIFGAVAVRTEDYATFKQAERLQLAKASRSAIPARFMARIARSLKRLDANKDGKITKSEVPRRQLRYFRMFDSNNDGVIDEKELEAVLKSRRKRR